ncbi:MAG: D-tyrosyl-tRNA(Tyr) deacylase [Ruminococcaceae bacterium]|nr:D-tyrosyl-tRNA(Tyr) deacylase [Oscillospiraceae bacterium]
MRAVVTRVKSASVKIEGTTHGAIEHGLLILLGVAPTDTAAHCAKLADKILGLRIFEDENGKMNRSLSDVEGNVLVVSQFTLFADCRHGRRPSFIGAGGPDIAIPLYEQFLNECRNRGFAPQHGQFGADMQVASINDGPVTIVLDTDELM